MWYKLESEILKLNLSDSAVIVYTVLADANRTLPNDWTMKRKTIAERTGRSIRTVSNALNELQQAGLIVRFRTGRASYYTIKELTPGAAHSERQKEINIL